MNAAALQIELVKARWATRFAREEARTDELTGLGNRRRFNETVESWLDDAAPFAVVLFDLANLKAANDALGHVGADAILEGVGRCLRADGDLAVRLGGDEFAVLLPRASAAQAEAVCRRIEEAVGVRRCGGRSVFLAGGVATWAPGDRPLEEALVAADLELEARKSRRKLALGEPTART